MELKEVIRRRRTIRRFKQQPVSDELLRELLEAARLAPSAGNRQVLRYLVIRTPALVQAVLKHTAWAAYVQPRRTPEWGRSAPAAFIAVLPGGESGELAADAGAAIENLLLRAHDLGLGACWIGAFLRADVATLLALPPGRQPLYLVAVGWPDESPCQDDIGADGSPKYFLDAQDRLHVPKYTVAALAEWR